MENATKALTMAAGILIALIIISLLVIMFTRISSVQKANLSNEEARQIAEFNGKYTKYKGKHVYGTEVVTVINRGLEDGVSVFVDGTQRNNYIKTATGTEYYEKKYKCIDIQYNSDGRVSAIYFEIK